MKHKFLIQKIALISLCIFTFLGYAGLRIRNASFIHSPRSSGDTMEYMRIASLNIFSGEFWATSKPPITSLFYKLLNLNPGMIFIFQLVFSIVCWGILAFVISNTIKTTWLKPFAFGFILAFTCSRDLIMWDPFLGSESLDLSFFALAIALALSLIQEWKPLKTILLLIVSFLLVFIRDTNAYLFLMIAFLLLAVMWFTKHRRALLLMSSAFVILFLISSQLARIGLRPFRAFLMVSTLRTFKNPEYVSYFEAHGMPINHTLEVLIERSKEPLMPRQANIYPDLNNDPNLDEFRTWVKNEGTKTYLQFLWFFKADTFQNLFHEPQGVFAPDVYYYTATGYRPIIQNQRISEALYPFNFGLLYFFVTNLIAAFCLPIAVKHRQFLWLVPLVMILLTYPQAVLVWNADAMDISRHSIQHNIQLRLGGWILLFYMIDTLAICISEWLVRNSPRYARFLFRKNTETEAIK